MKIDHWHKFELGKGIPATCKVVLGITRPPLIVSLKYDKKSAETTSIYIGYDIPEPNATNKDIVKFGQPA